jgi:hypothetical protein
MCENPVCNNQIFKLFIQFCHFRLQNLLPIGTLLEEKPFRVEIRSSHPTAITIELGAYTSAVLTTTYGPSPWLCLPVALTLKSLTALIIGLLTLRLSGHYFVVGTIAWGN